MLEHYPQYLKPEDAPASASSTGTESVEAGVDKLKVSDDGDAAESKPKSGKKSKGKKKLTLAEKQAAAGGGDAWSDEDDHPAEAAADDEENGDDDEEGSDDSDSSDKPKRRIKQTSALEAAASKSSGKTAKSKAAEKILISKAQRSKNKYITTIRGLDSYGLTLKEVAKAMSKKFACSASVVKVVPSGQEIAIQGDVQQDAPDFLVEKFGSQIPEDQIYIVAEGTGKKTKAFD